MVIARKMKRAPVVGTNNRHRFFKNGIYIKEWYFSTCVLCLRSPPQVLRFFATYKLQSH